MAVKRAEQMGDLHLLSLQWSLADKEHPTGGNKMTLYSSDRGTMKWSWSEQVSAADSELTVNIGRERSGYLNTLTAGNWCFIQ
jgi:hypothetical protein